jgi:Flp pilus assembly pilin Flp
MKDGGLSVAEPATGAHPPNLRRRVRGLPARASNDDGQTYVEYALVAVLVAVGVSVLAAWANLGTAFAAALQSVADAL